MSYLAVDLEPDITLGATLDDWTNSHETDDESLALLDVDHHLPPNIRTGKEVPSWHNAQVTILLDEALVFLEDLLGIMSACLSVLRRKPTDLRVHDIRRYVRVRNVLAELATELGLDLLEFNGCKASTGSAVNSGLVADDLGAKGLWEATDGLAKVTLEELHN